MTRWDTPTGMTDACLSASARQGDRQAFGELVSRHQAGVIRFVARMVGDRALAEDTAQDAFLRAWQRLDTYDPQRSFRNWVFSIAAHLALDRLRGEPQITAVDSTELAEAEPGPEPQVEILERQAAVRRAVLALPLATKAVLVLREYERLSYAEISSVLGIPVGTVMSRLNYARTRLRATLADLMEKE